jgi:GNAT superfamily N-acetyltransferase
MRDHNNPSCAVTALSMAEIPLIRVVPVDAVVRPLLLALEVSAHQRDHVGTSADMLADVAACPDSEAMAILYDGRPVGCYRLDADARGVAGRDLDYSARAIRAFLIDARWQHRGVGAAALAALIADVVKRHPDVRLLALSASVDNAVALRMYRRAGFTDSGELYHGGRSGPMHLWLRTLP